MMMVVRPFTCPLCLHQASLTTTPTTPPPAAAAAAAATPVTPTRTPPPAVATAPPVMTTTKASFLFEPSNKCNAVNQHTVFGAVSHQIRRVVHSEISVIICYYFCRAVNYVFHSAICYQICRGHPLQDRAALHQAESLPLYCHRLHQPFPSESSSKSGDETVCVFEEKSDDNVLEEATKL